MIFNSIGNLKHIFLTISLLIIACLSFWYFGLYIKDEEAHAHAHKAQTIDIGIPYASVEWHVSHIPFTPSSNETIADKLSISKALFSAPPAQNGSIWRKIAGQFTLNHYADNPRVKKEIRHILADKHSFEATLKRSGPYIHYIYNQTQDRKLPAELTLIPIIESEYNPNDHDKSGASGLWQLMPGTARVLGVKVGNGHDGRYNVAASTKAALTFFNDLKTQFKGNWNLVFAAYNCGPGCVSSAIKRANTHDYFDLSVPLETKIYVPRLLAMAIIIKNADKYGITLPHLKNPTNNSIQDMAAKSK